MNNPDLNRNNVGNNRSRMSVADKAAKKVADLPEVDRANIIVTDNNAYVAAKLDRSSRNELTSDIEKKISRKVKSVDPSIDNVYVSVNPDFYDRMNTYAGDIRNGRPISGFFEEFSDTIRRVFPNAR
jgi:YhcN/YlaJ family sporulation lipoprotein